MLRTLRETLSRVAGPTLLAALLAACRAPATRSAAARPADPSRVEFIAHRGESADAPENTMAAFRLAWARNDAAIELDVHLTSDGQLVVSHDENTRRTTGVDRVIKTTTLAELRTLDAGRWKGAQWAGERLPTLDEVLATIPDGRRCFIEVKVGAEAIPALERAVRASGKRAGQLVVISFHLDAVAEAKRRMPELKAYLLSGFDRDSTIPGGWRPSVDSLIAQARRAKLDGLDLPLTDALTPASVGRIRAARLGFYAWTLDDTIAVNKALALGVDGITSNRAAQLRAVVGGR